MRFKLDENLDPRFAAPLVSAGHDVSNVRAQGLGGRSGEVVYGVCVSERRILLTLNLDFSNSVRFPVAGTPGIIILRPRKATLPLIEGLLRELPSLLQTRSPSGGLWVVEFGRLRIFTPEERDQV